MPWFEVVALEKFLVRTTYRFSADSVEQAKQRVLNGEEAYGRHEIEEGDEEFIEFESVEEVPAPG